MTLNEYTPASPQLRRQLLEQAIETLEYQRIVVDEIEEDRVQENAARWAGAG